ncbi:PH domain-containing protein [Hymenobacter rubripertinctus]|uniref:PH domain-containing protein n=1 Tax=Hymenobacter rubripertinctus TaxID=2029981 RepID=A0A418QYI8_9BACT|nr:PH domain-containing protein [Hymenobacter rubripertinctus]RIY10221.1 PH domain-containing protein [Hymenobacter rubripertinctus]
MTNYDIENELKSNLISDEKLIWTGKPKTGIVFRSSDAFLIPFSLRWGGFAVFWETSVLATGAPFPFALFGIPFILVGLYITVGRFFLDAKKRANTIYGITPDRIIIKTGIFSMEIKSLNIRTLSDVTINQKADNSGTITLGPTDFRYAMMQGMEWPGANQPPRLELIEDVKSVYDKIINLQRQK